MSIQSSKKLNKDTNEFYAIWDSIISPTIDEFSDTYSTYIKKKSEKRVHLLLSFLYNNYKKYFIRSFMALRTRNIDRHKIASCILKAIMVVKPIKIKKRAFNSAIKTNSINNKDQTIIYFINGYLALSVAFSILDAYIEADPAKVFNHKVIPPDPFRPEDDDYFLDVCLDLYFHDAKKINIVTYSNFFFLIEKYSCRRFQCENLQKEMTTYLINHNDCKDKIEAQKLIDEIRLQEFQGTL